MKPRLTPSLSQHLVLTPQLRQAIRLLQLSATELEQELAEAVASNPLLEWEDAAVTIPAPEAAAAGTGDEAQPPAPQDWEPPADDWRERLGPADPDDDHVERPHANPPETLHDHLLSQLHLERLSPGELRLGVALIEAIDEDGYLREPLAELAAGAGATTEAAAIVLHRIQCLDPAGVGARDLGECLRLQLQALPAATPWRALALRVAGDLLPELPRIGTDGLAERLGCSPEEAEAAVCLLRSLDPRPGARHGALPESHFVTPDCVVWRQGGLWRVALAQAAQPGVIIHRGYAALVGQAGKDDPWLRERLQEARWLIKGLQARSATLLRVVRYLARAQAAFLEFGPQALRPLTLRDVAQALQMHESTVSRAVAHKHVRTPRGTLPLRAFFASGIGTDHGGNASSTAIQAMIRQLLQSEDPRRPLSDARLAEALKAMGVPVARRTVAKYREGMNIPPSQERVRLG